MGMPQFGALPSGLSAERIASSPHFKDGVAQNPVPTSTGSMRKMAPVLAEYITDRSERVPKISIPTVRPNLDTATGEGKGVRVTWLGHSAMLLNVDGTTILTDPVFSQRASPFQWSGPARFFDAPLAVDALPDLDAVLISHDHFDHLDYGTIKALADKGHRFVTALGVGAHLSSWGISEDRITELDWWEETQVGNLTVVAAPGRHFSGRTSGGGNHSLWASWAFIGEHSRAWFSGDTGFFEGAREIGERLGPFDLTLIEAGAHHPAWGNVHLGPEGAHKMHQAVRGKTWMPVHWGTFNLALHAWDHPIVVAQALAKEFGTDLLATLPGETARANAPQVAALWQERATLAAQSDVPIVNASDAKASGAIASVTVQSAAVADET